jgi:hypothetical protein
MFSAEALAPRLADAFVRPAQGFLSPTPAAGNYKRELRLETVCYISDLLKTSDMQTLYNKVHVYCLLVVYVTTNSDCNL